MKRAASHEEHMSNNGRLEVVGGILSSVLMLEWNVNLYPQICFFSGETKHLDLFLMLAKIINNMLTKESLHS